MYYSTYDPFTLLGCSLTLFVSGLVGTLLLLVLDAILRTSGPWLLIVGLGLLFLDYQLVEYAEAELAL